MAEEGSEVQETKAPDVPMQIIQDMLEQGQGTKTLELEIAGRTITIRYRTLSWLEKSKVLSEALEYVTTTNDAGETELQVKIHHDVFRKAALKIMIVETPIPFTDALLDVIPSEVGEQLEKIIPSPFSSEQAAAVKKERGGSSEETPR